MEVDPRRFRALVAEALDSLPSQWQPMLAQVVVLVEEVASEEDLSLVRMGPEEGHDLLGLYVGIPLTERGAFDEGLPDRIMIYRRPILGICRSHEDVLREVQQTVLHELGHHFGLAEDDLPF
jgi:predicted Zn-dependent protease with MMP-like domain